MQYTLILSDRIVKTMWLVNVTRTLRKTHLLTLNYSRGWNLGIVFLVPDVINSWSRNRISRSGSWLSWRLAIETKEVSQIFAELASPADTSVRYGCTSAFDWRGCTCANRLLWNNWLLWQYHSGLNEAFLVIELLKSSWWMRRWCCWNNWGVYSA